MLQAAYHGCPLADAVEALETQLASRRPTINAAMALPGPTLQSVVQSLLKENLVLAAGAPGGAGTGLGASLAVVDKDGHATTLAPFKALEAAMGGYNLLTEAGRRDALTAALAPGDLVLVLRVVFRDFSPDKADRGADRMASRNATLGAFSGLRAHLHEYINWYMRVDIATGVVNPRLAKYEFASLMHRTQLDLFSAFSLDKMDLIAAPGGMLGYAYRRDALPRPLTIDPRDYYCTVSVIRDLAQFTSKLLNSIGIPDVLPVGAAGYTFRSFCEFYITILELAGRLPLLKDQYEHLAACDEQFRSALLCISVTLQEVVGHADIGSQTMAIAVLADDSEPITRLKQISQDVDRKVQARMDLAGLLPSSSSFAGAVDFHNLKLSDQAWTKSSLKRKVGEDLPIGRGTFDPIDPFEAEEQVGKSPGSGGLPPGVLGGTWKWLDKAKTLLCISGRVWNIKELAKHLGVPVSGPSAPCWPYLLAICDDKNRPARCDRWATQGHGTAKDPPHAFLSTVKAAALAGTYARPATPEERQGLSKEIDWSKAPKEYQQRGRGRGRGGRARGRARQQQGGTSFRRPSFP